MSPDSKIDSEPFERLLELFCKMCPSFNSPWLMLIGLFWSQFLINFFIHFHAA